MPNLTTVGSDLVISEAKLQSIDLLALTKVGGNLFIDDLPLTSLDGFGGLKDVGGTLRISSLNNLSSFSGLQNLTKVGENIYLTDLGDESDLQNLQSLVLPNLAISDNEMRSHSGQK